MTADTTAARGRAIPIGIILVMLSCVVRAVWALWNVARFSQYVISGAMGISGVLAFSLFDGIVWAVLAIGVWRAARNFRLATMVWCGVGIVLSGYGLLSTMLQRPGYHYVLWLIVPILLVDFAVIGYLSQDSAKSWFSGEASAAAA
jgi:hypothetical protein